MLVIIIEPVLDRTGPL